MKILPIIYLPFCAIVSTLGVLTFMPVRTICGKAASISNVKQLATGAMIYATDFDDRLFPAESWFDAEMPYLKNEAMADDFDLPGPNEKYGFAFFKPLAREIPENLKNAPTVPFFFPSDLRVRNAASGLGTLPAVPRNTKGHPVSFADTHAEHKPAAWATTRPKLIFK